MGVTWAKVFPVPQKQALTKIHQSKTQFAGTHHVVYRELVLSKHVFIFCPSQENKEGRRANCIDNPSIAGLRVGLMQGRGTLVMSHDQLEQ